MRNNEYNHRYVIADKNSELNLKELFKENHGEKTRTEHLTINGHEIEIEMSKNLDVDIDDLNGLINTLEDIERNDLKIKIESVEIKGKQSLSEKGIGYNEIRDYYGITINTVIETLECDYLISPDFFKTKCVDPLNTGEICLENTKIIYSSKIKISPNEMTEYGFKEMKGGYSRTVVNVENYGDVLLEYPSEMKDIPLKEVTNRISNIGGNTGQWHVMELIMDP